MLDLTSAVLLLLGLACLDSASGMGFTLPAEGSLCLEEVLPEGSAGLFVRCSLEKDDLLKLDVYDTGLELIASAESTKELSEVVHTGGRSNAVTLCFRAKPLLKVTYDAAFMRVLDEGMTARMRESVDKMMARRVELNSALEGLSLASLGTSTALSTTSHHLTVFGWIVVSLVVLTALSLVRYTTSIVRRARPRHMLLPRSSYKEPRKRHMRP